MTIKTLIAGLIAFFPLCAGAQAFYASASTALALPENSSGNFTHEGTEHRADLGLKRAIELSGTLGHEWANGWRVEARLGYRSHDVLRLFSDTELTGVFEQLRDAPAPSPVHTVDASGSLSALSLMANVGRSFRAGERFRPYVSAGAGLVKLRAEVERIEHQRIGSRSPTTVETARKGDDILDPARYGHSIAVGEVNEEREIYHHYAKGQTKYVDVWAPADSVPVATSSRNTDGTAGFSHEYIEEDGTSYATSHVAAAAAMWLLRHYDTLNEKYPEPWQRVEAFRTVAKATGTAMCGAHPLPEKTGILNIEALLKEPLPLACALERQSNLLPVDPGPPERPEERR